MSARDVSAVLWVAMSAVAGLVLAEGALRVALPARTGYHVIAPGTRWTLHIDPAVVRGVDSVGHYTVNSAGVRGREPVPDSSEYHIMAVGGSTTECAVLDDSKAWPHLLEQSLNATRGRVWVGNVGKSGLTTREHVLHVKYLLTQQPHVDVVLALVGVNDMLGAVRQGNAYHLPESVLTPSGERHAMRRAFAVFPGMERFPVAGEGDHIPWYRATAIWDLARRAKLRWTSRPSHAMDAQTGLVRARAHRAQTPQTDSVPPLQRPLAEYRRNLEAMAMLARSHRARLILLTQPTLWRAAMSDNEQRDLWLGWLGEGWQSAAAYYSPAALDRAMDAYNAVTREVCAAQNVECIDLASSIAKTSKTFYDDLHFTNAGAKAVAMAISAHLSAR